MPTSPCSSRTARTLPRVALATGLFAAAAFVRLDAADPAPTAPDVVELPKLNVTDSRDLPPPEAWRYTQIPGIEVLSNAPDRETSRMMREFQIFRVALDAFKWPWATRPLPPVTIILCGRGNSFDVFKPAQAATDASPLVARASLTLANAERAFVVVDVATKTISLTPDAVTGADGAIEFGSSEFDVDHYKQLYREYTHLVIANAAGVAPAAWLEEGLIQIVTAVKLDKRSFVFGQIENPNTISAQQEAANAANAAAAEAGDTTSAAINAPVEDRDFNSALQRRRLLAFDGFFGVARDSEAARNPIGTNVWAKQAYAFVHYGLYGSGGRNRKAFETFVERTLKTPPTEKIFEECFDTPYKKFLTTLRGYIDFTDYKYDEFTIKGGGKFDFPAPEIRDAKESESAHLKGEALRIAGKNPEAHTLLLAAYSRGERDPQFLASLGLSELALGNTARARKFLEAAVAAKTSRARAYVEVAQLRLEEATKPQPPATAETRLTAAQLSSVLQPLFAARRLVPLYAEVYELIGDAWSKSEIPPKAENLTVLIEGMKQFPYDAPLAYRTAELCARIGDTKAAYGIAGHALKIARAPELRAKVEKLLASLPAPAPAAATPAASPPPAKP